MSTDAEAFIWRLVLAEMQRFSDWLETSPKFEPVVIGRRGELTKAAAVKGAAAWKRACQDAQHGLWLGPYVEGYEDDALAEGYEDDPPAAEIPEDEGRRFRFLCWWAEAVGITREAWPAAEALTPFQGLWVLLARNGYFGAAVQQACVAACRAEDEPPC